MYDTIITYIMYMKRIARTMSITGFGINVFLFDAKTLLVNILIQTCAKCNYPYL